MKKSIFILALVMIILTVSCFNTGCRQSASKKTETNKQADLASFKKEIEIRLREFENLLRKGDSMALGEMYTIDAEIIPETAGRENIIKTFGSMIRDSITGTFETTNLWGSDQLLVEEGKGAWYNKNNQVAGRGKYLLVWKKDSGVWKILRDTWFPEK